MIKLSKIELRTTCTIIHNYNLGDSKQLEKHFFVWNQVTFSGTLRGVYYDKRRKDLYLPGGIDLPWLIRLFGNDVEKIEPNRYNKVNQIMLKVLPRDKEQSTALNFLIGKGQYSTNAKLSQLSLNLSTGVGKTYVAVAVSAAYSVKTIMITKGNEVLTQWKLKIMEYTDTKEDEIYLISGKLSILMILNGMKDTSKIKYFLATHDTLRAYAKQHRTWRKVGELFDLLRIGIKIYDEAHKNFDNMCMIDFFTNTWKTYYLTATPYRSDWQEDVIYQSALKNVPKLSLFDPDKTPHTQYIALCYDSHPDPLEMKRITSNPYKFSLPLYADYLVQKENYYKILIIIMRFIEVKITGRVLIYIGKNSAIQTTYNFLKKYYPKYSIGIFSSIIQNSDKKHLELENQIILTTTKSAGDALDIPHLQLSVVLNEPFKSKVLAIQTLGRTRNKNTYYMEAVDESFRTNRNHYDYKVKNIFMKYATDVKEINLPDNVLDSTVKGILLGYMERTKNLDNPKLKQVVSVNINIPELDNNK